MALIFMNDKWLTRNYRVKTNFSSQLGNERQFTFF